MYLRKLFALSVWMIPFCQINCQVLEIAKPDSLLTYNDEVFMVRQRLIMGTAFTVTGISAMYFANQISNKKIKTTIHPDSLIWPAAAFFGMGMACYLNSWLHFRKANFIVNEQGFGIAINLYRKQNIE